MAAVIEASQLCALCGEPNGCAMAAGAASAESCWCMNEKMPAQLAERLQASGAEQCVCQACLRGFEVAAAR